MKTYITNINTTVIHITLLAMFVVQDLAIFLNPSLLSDLPKHLIRQMREIDQVIYDTLFKLQGNNDIQIKIQLCIRNKKYKTASTTSVGYYGILLTSASSLSNFLPQRDQSKAVFQNLYQMPIGINVQIKSLKFMKQIVYFTR